MNIFLHVRIFFLSCSYGLQRWIDFPVWIFLDQVLHENLAFSRLLVIAVCSLCSRDNCCSMETKGCLKCFSCSNGNCRADHYFTACWIFFSQGAYLSVCFCLTKTTCYHWQKNNLFWVRCDSMDWISAKVAAPDLFWEYTAFPYTHTMIGIPPHNLSFFFKIPCKWNETLYTIRRCSGLARLQSMPAVIGRLQFSLESIQCLNCNCTAHWSPSMPPLIFFSHYCLDFVGDELPNHSVFLLDFDFGISFENSFSGKIWHIAPR